MTESRYACAINLEWPMLSDNESLQWSRRYYGHDAMGPRFVSLPIVDRNRPLERYDKSEDFFCCAQQRRNHALWAAVRALPAPEKTAYIRQNGLNLVRIDKASRERRGRIRRINFRHCVGPVNAALLATKCFLCKLMRRHRFGGATCYA